MLKIPDYIPWQGWIIQPILGGYVVYDRVDRSVPKSVILSSVESATAYIVGMNNRG